MILPERSRANNPFANAYRDSHTCRYTQLGAVASGAVRQFEATGAASTFRGHLADWGIQLPVNLFEKRVLERE